MTGFSNTIDWGQRY